MVFQISGRKICIKGKEVKRGLSAEILEKNLKRIKNFGGILAMNDLNNIIINSYPVSLIINHNKHWISIFIDKKNVEIFDSTAQLFSELPKPLTYFLSRHYFKNIKYNGKLQTNDSKICGLYALYFVLMKSKQYSWSKIMNILKTKSKTDYFIKKLFKC